jgi:hypothetical protein
MYINPPNQSSKRKNNYKLSSQTSKCILVQRLGYNISKLLFYRYMDDVYVSLLNIVSQEVVPHFYVFGSGLEHRVFGNTNGTRAITHERYIGTLLTKVTQRVCNPKQLGATTSGSNILGFSGRLSYTRLFARRPRNKRRSQKLLSSRSQFLFDSTPRKVDIRKTKKRKGRGCRVPKTELRSVSKIPEDPLDGLPM